MVEVTLEFLQCTTASVNVVMRDSTANRPSIQGGSYSVTLYTYTVAMHTHIITCPAARSQPSVVSHTLSAAHNICNPLYDTAEEITTSSDNRHTSEDRIQKRIGSIPQHILDYA